MSYAIIARAAAVVAGGATAVAASPVAASIGAGVAVIGAVSLLTGTARPSTLLRIGEDAVVAVPKSVARGAKNLAHSAKVEYSARQIASARKKLAKQLALINEADPATLAALQHDQTLIAARVDQLMGTPKAAPKKPAAKRAARSAKR